MAMLDRQGMKRWGQLALGAAVCSVPVLLACSFGSARMIRRDQVGGTLALQGARGHAWKDAEQQMAAHCGPGNYQVIKEEQVVVGQQTTTQGDVDTRETRQRRSNRQSENYSETTTTQDVTEYRITYECGAGSGAATAGGTQPAAGAAQPAPAPAPAEKPEPQADDTTATGTLDVSAEAGGEGQPAEDPMGN